MTPFAMAILLVLVGIFALLFIGHAVYVHLRERDRNAWKRPPAVRHTYTSRLLLEDQLGGPLLPYVPRQGRRVPDPEEAA